MAHSLTTLSILATDLDGTLIPLPGIAENQADLRILTALLQRYRTTLIYVTGRHFASVSEAIRVHQLPLPDWILCDVGTSVWQRDNNGSFQLVVDYSESMQAIIGNCDRCRLQNQLTMVPGLQLQEEEKQGLHKTSYYTDAARLSQVVRDIRRQLLSCSLPYQVISSVDPFNGSGLIDLLPAGVSKASALNWWRLRQEVSLDEVIFAGDSGNDLQPLTSGCRSIIVGNAAASVVDQVRTEHLRSGWKNRLFHARNHATSGVLEGICHFARRPGRTIRG